MRLHGLRAALALLAVCVALPAHAQAPGPHVATLSPPLSAQPSVDSAFLSAFRWRAVGPAHMGGRIADIEGIPSPSKTFYVATANGGIFKTTNDGVTFRALFQHEPVVAMGDIAIAPSDTNEIWAGTGDEDSRNTISPGAGIYKSTDGGLTWKLMGLQNTGAIGRVVVDPRDPNTVYVAALGHAWGANPERGLYKTTDGGKTWKRVKYISPKAGFVDVRLDPGNPDVVWAAAWQRVRTPYSLNSGGPGSGLFKSTDAGRSWTEIKGGGFPAGMKGRIGIAIARSNPQIVYALVEAEKNKDGTGGTGLYRTEDGGKTWKKMNDKDTRPFYYSQVRVDPKNPDRVYWSSTPLQFSTDGGKTVRTGANDVHVDDHALWIDPTDPQHFVLGDDGGIWQTWDAGGNYEFLNNIAIGQFYHVSYDMAIPYNVCGGLQDNGSWCGPSRRARGTLTNEMWKTVGGGDGFVTQQDPTNPDVVYAESQNAGITRMDVADGETVRLQKPDWQQQYRVWADSIILARQHGQEARVAELRRQQVADSVAQDLRYNWDAPYFISPFDHNTLYIGGNKVLKSTDRGDHLKIISPDLSNPADSGEVYISMNTTGGITKDVTGAENFGTIVSLAESYVQKGLLYAGTDDGKVWVSPDDGGHWNDISAHFHGVPAGSYVSRIEPSHFDPNTFFVAFDNHQRDDFRPYLFMTSDGGQTFHSIAAGLPTSSPQDYVHVVRQDPVNPDLLFAGTDIGAYVSLDKGASWHRFMSNLPSVPVRDFQIQPRDHELIAGTFGRSIWIVGIAPLEQLKTRTLADAPVLFQPAPGLEYSSPPVGGQSMGQQWFQAPSPQFGAALQYYVPGNGGAAAAADRSGRMNDGGGPRGRGGMMGQHGRARGPQAHLAILDAQGDTIQTLTGPQTPGLHTVTWNLRHKPAPPKPLSPSQVQDSIKADKALHEVADSLVKTGMNRQALDRAIAMFESRDRSGFRRFFGGGGRGNMAGEKFVERPAESPAPGARRAQNRRGGGAGPALSPDLLRTLFETVRQRGIRFPGGRGGFFGGGGPQTVDPGYYTVVLTVGGHSMTETLKVDRARGYGTFATDDGPSR